MSLSGARTKRMKWNFPIFDTLNVSDVDVLEKERIIPNLEKAQTNALG